MDPKLPPDHARDLLRDIKRQSLTLPLPKQSSGDGVILMKDLLIPEGTEFIQLAYHSLLNREADPKGLDHYRQQVDCLRLSKRQVLCQLHYSPEGITNQVKIKGLPNVWSYRFSRLWQSLMRKILERLSILLNLPSLQGQVKQQQLELEKQQNAYFYQKYYDAFELAFRGSKQLLLERFRYYLFYVDQIGVDKKKNCLDLGCGHGVWLDIMRDHGQNPQGVDLNQDMVNQCLARGHQVSCVDMLQHLSEKTTNCMDLITGFQIIEHIQTDDLVRLVEESFRVLGSGGMILFETPNPENIRTSAYMFYLDPTHSVPVHPMFVQFLFEQVGFVEIELLKLHPADQFPQIQDPVIDPLIRGAQDYTLIGRKP